jgi:hypothetical protein
VGSKQVGGCGPDAFTGASHKDGLSPKVETAPRELQVCHISIIFFP